MKMRAFQDPKSEDYGGYAVGVGDSQEDTNPMDSAFKKKALGDPTSAEDLNARVEQVVNMVKEIEADVMESGVYKDRASITALRALAEDAQALRDSWMEQKNVDEAPELDPNAGSGLKEIVQGGPKEDFTGNPFGGQIFRMK